MSTQIVSTLFALCFQGNSIRNRSRPSSSPSCQYMYPIMVVLCGQRSSACSPQLYLFYCLSSANHYQSASEGNPLCVSHRCHLGLIPWNKQTSKWNHVAVCPSISLSLPTPVINLSGHGGKAYYGLWLWLHINYSLWGSNESSPLDCLSLSVRVNIKGRRDNKQEVKSTYLNLR